MHLKMATLRVFLMKGRLWYETVKEEALFGTNWE